MALEPQTKTIDGMEVTVNMLPARRSMRLLHRLQQVGIPAVIQTVGGLLSAAKDDDRPLSGDIDFAAIARALESALTKLDEATFDHLVKELLHGAVVDNHPVDAHFDTLFAGRLATVYKILAFALEVNYADFFGAVRGLFGGEAAAAKLAEAQSIFASLRNPGPSGESSPSE